MGFRFRKRLRIFPGLWLNLSKKGGSLSVGSRGDRGAARDSGLSYKKPGAGSLVACRACHSAARGRYGRSRRILVLPRYAGVPLKENYPLSQAPENAIIRRLSLRPLRTIL